MDFGEFHKMAEQSQKPRSIENVWGYMDRSLGEVDGRTVLQHLIFMVFVCGGSVVMVSFRQTVKSCFESYEVEDEGKRVCSGRCSTGGYFKN